MRANKARSATSTLRLSQQQARQAILRAQGLGPGREGVGAGTGDIPSLKSPSLKSPSLKSPSLEKLVERTGLVRTLGGVDAYVALRARAPWLQRAELDAAVECGELRVLPSVRGCIYLVPRCYQAASLRLAEHLSRKRSEREHQKIGIRPGELEQVGDAIVAALAAGPMTPIQLRQALPDGVVRSLGEVGKKVGISSTLPPALRQLEFAGRIERALADQRLDSEQYRWRLPSSNPFDGVELPPDPTGLYAIFAELYFRAAGLGSKKSFAAWAGLSQRDAAAAMEQVELVPVTLDDGVEVQALAERADTLAALAEQPAGVALLPFEDNLAGLHGGPAFFVDPAYHGIPVPVWGRGKGSTLGDVHHSTLRTVVANDRIAGFWEFDPDAGEIVYQCFDESAAAGCETSLQNTAADLGRFLREDVGHGRSFSLDKDDSLRQRVAQIRQLAG